MKKKKHSLYRANNFVKVKKTQKHIWEAMEQKR